MTRTLQYRAVRPLWVACLALLGCALAASDGGAEPAPPPNSSRIVEIYPAERGPAGGDAAGSIDPSGYARPDMIVGIYDGQFELVPAGGLDNLRYFAQAVADLTASCPNLGLERARFEILPYVLASSADLTRRFQTGELTDSEIAQAIWLGVLGLNRRWSCTWDPASGVPFDQAQAECDQAAAASAELGVWPSLDAEADIALFLGRHACTGPEAARLARNLIAFARDAHTRLNFLGEMPAPDSALGRAYRSVFANCARSAPNNREDAWCGCYVRTLHRLRVPLTVVEALAGNPFVDGRTYMDWIVASVPGGGEIYRCTEQHAQALAWRERVAPRPTACLIDDAASAGGRHQCTYRAAWGEFTTTQPSCAPAIDSRAWGFREVDCAAAGAVAALSAGPRVWQDGAWSYIDYENEVPDDFVAALPADARHRHPLSVRFLKRERPGLLKRMTLQMYVPDWGRLRDPAAMNAIAADVAALDREGALVLVCTYEAARGTDRRTYWYESVPRIVREGRLSPALSPHPFAQIAGAATTCPAQAP